MKALAAVAHPDDCVIFARPFIETYSGFEWTILYLTYWSWDARAKEVTEYWSKKNVLTLFLGFNDDYEYVKRGELGFDKEQALQEINNISKQYQLILTHNQNGEYGHLHHVLVNQAVQQNDVPKVYFGDITSYNTTYTTMEPVDLDELPLHKEVISWFVDRDIGRYTITPEAKELIPCEKEKIV